MEQKDGDKVTFILFVYVRIQPALYRPSYNSVGLLFLGSFLQGFSRCPLLDEQDKSHAFLVPGH